MDRFPRLRERADQRAGTLSGGEQQMCAIARALMALPSLLMLDEPSHGIWDEPWTPNGYGLGACEVDRAALADGVGDTEAAEHAPVKHGDAEAAEYNQRRTDSSKIGEGG